MAVFPDSVGGAAKIAIFTPVTAVRRVGIERLGWNVGCGVGIRDILKSMIYNYVRCPASTTDL